MNLARTMISVLIALFVLLGSVGGLGAAAAREAPDEVPDGFTFAEHRIGDRGRYTLTTIRLTEDGYDIVEPEEHALTFHWATPRVERDLTGAGYMANILEYQDPDEPPSWWAYEPGTMRTISHSFGWSGSEDGLANTGYLVGPRDPGEDDGVRNACGLYNRLAGGTVGLDGALDLFPRCAWGGVTWTDALQFRATATERLGDMDTVMFTAEGDLWDLVGLIVDDIPPDAYHMWYTESIPYPIRMAYSGWEPNEFHIFRLTSFERGHTPLLERGHQVHPPVEPAEIERPPAIGFDDRGIDHPFPLSDALEAAREDTNVAAYMDRGAWTVVDAEGKQYVGADPRHAWEIELWNEAAPFHFTIERRPLEDVQALMGESPYTITRAAPERQQYPLFSQMTQPVPTIASLMEQWEAFSGEQGANAYSITRLCSGDLCERAHVVVDAGRVVVEEGGTLPGDAQRVAESRNNWRYAHWHYYHTDLPDDVPSKEREQISWDLIVDELQGDSERPLLGIGAPTGQSQVPPDEGALGAAVPIWSWPDRPSAYVGAGILAFTAAAFYYFWPLLKTGSLGLFSRVRDPQVIAEHPVRRQILDAIAANPGAHAAALRRTLDVGAGAFQHHTRKLVDAGLITRVQQGGYTCHFLKGAADHRVMAGAPALRAPAARAILEAILAQPGIAAGAAAKAAGVAASTATHHIRRLEEAGLVHATRSGNATRLMPSEMAKQGLDAIAA